MRTKLFSWVLLSCVALFFAASGQAAQEKIAGKIIAAKVRGTVTALNKADNSTKVLKDSDAVSAGYVISTGPNSSVVLLFANGSAVDLSADSVLSIDEFLLDPFDPKYSISEAKDEPSTSVTKLSLERGELVGNVKHLNREQGSSYTVNTPVGAAGIRGTTFRFALGTDAAGKPYMKYSTSEGTIFLKALDGAERLIPAGKEVNISFDTATDAAGAVSVVLSSLKVTGVDDMSSETQAIIARAFQEILRALPNLLNRNGLGPHALPGREQTTPGDGRSGG